jgi:hypothetical protein
MCNTKTKGVEKDEFARKKYPVEIVIHTSKE